MGVDEGFLGFMHATFARLLVEMDLSKYLPIDLELKSSNIIWLQLVDCEGIYFKFRRCF